MHPYRDMPTVAARRVEACREELVLYALLVAIGLIPVVIALLQHARFGVWETIGLLMACTGLVGLVVQVLRAPSRHRGG